MILVAPSPFTCTQVPNLYFWAVGTALGPLCNGDIGDILHNGDQISFKPHPEPVAFPACLTHIRQFGDLGTNFYFLLKALPCVQLTRGSWVCFPAQFCSGSQRPRREMNALVNTKINPRGQSYRVKPAEMPPAW